MKPLVDWPESLLGQTVEKESNLEKIITNP